jgi:hypothetical protein
VTLLIITYFCEYKVGADPHGKSSSEDAGTLHTLRTTAAQCYRDTYA